MDNPNKSVKRACFSERIPLSDEEIERHGLKELGYKKTIDVDVSQDGLIDNFTLSLDTVSVEQRFDMIVDVNYFGGKAALMYYSDSCKLDRFFYTSDEVVDSEKFGLALKDIDNDGHKDVIYYGTDDKGRLGYYVYYNLNSEPANDVSVPSTFVIKTVKLGSLTEIEGFTVIFENFQDQDEIETSDAIHGILFHPANAEFVQIDDGPLVKVDHGKLITLEGSSNPTTPSPISLHDVFHVNFYDGERNNIKSIRVTQRVEDKIETQFKQDGTRYVLFKAHKSSKDFLGFYNSIEGPVEGKKKSIETLLGKHPLTVIFYDSKKDLAQGCASSSFYDDGRVFVSTDTSSGKAIKTICHEHTHNIESTLSKTPLLTSLFDEFRAAHSPIFDFLNQYFGENSGDHTQDTPGELFATTTAIIAFGEEFFSQQLTEYTKNNPSLGPRLRSDLKNLFLAYKKIVLQNGTKEGVDLVDRFNVTE